ncbi:MAG TPA: hypothetical protein VL172_03635 [Kofleriaceae bacterium]|nr:hypothetical protein [Kofleriaceae bacterium]
MRVLFACWLVVGGCDMGDPSFVTSPDGGGPSDAGPPQLGVRGRFEVIEGIDLRPGGAQAFSALDGDITDSDLWPLYHLTALSGACRIYSLDPPYCSPTCDGICIAEDMCMPSAHSLSAGKVTIDGLLQSVTLSRQVDNSYTADDPLPMDLFSSEAVVEIDAAGDEVSWFVMSTGGVRPIDSDLPPAAVVLDGSDDFTITWPNPDASTNVTLEIRATNAYRGQPAPAILECIGPDQGSLTVPRGLIQLFPPALASCTADVDCPRARLRRQHQDSVIRSDIPIELVVAHEVRFTVDHR